MMLQLCGLTYTLSSTNAKNIIALVRSSAPDAFMHEPFVSD